MNTSKINRFEIIDHTVCTKCDGEMWIDPDNNSKPVQCDMCAGLGCPGRTVVVWDGNKQIDIDIQDDERTLKVYIHDRYEEEYNRENEDRTNES